MISPTSRGTAAFLFCTFVASAAQADLSAQDVWSDWRAYLEGTGYSVTATETTSGDTLTVSDTTLTFDVPEDEIAIEIRMGDLAFTENGDGTVNVGFPDVMPIVVDGKTEDDEDFTIAIDYTQSGFSMVASGIPADIKYDYSANSVSIELNEAKVNGLILSSDIVRGKLDIADITGSTRMQTDDLRTYTQTGETGEMSYDLMFQDPQDGGQFVWTGSNEGITLDSVSTLPETINIENMAISLDEGLAVKGGFAYGPGSSSLSFQDESDTFSYESQSQGGRLDVVFGPGGVGYDVQQSQIVVNVAGSEIPLPISLTAADVVFKFLIPVVQADEAQDFALTIDMSDFTMSDLIWGIFDPTGQLPRDPATLTMALTGKAKLLANIMDPEVAEQMESGPPLAELESLTVTELEVTAAGASLTGAGTFTFDNSDLATFNGLPRPMGSLDLKLAGGNGLLDKLVAMGLVPEEQAGGARLMMGLFAVPGDAPDTLNSKIEINDQGHILANGQRIQ